MELIIPDLGSFYVGRDGSTNLSIPTDSLLRIIRDKALKYMDVVGDSLGLYQPVIADRFGKAKFSKLTQPKHTLQSKKDCENWNPKGTMRFIPEETAVYGYEHMSEHCNDVFADCMRYVKGTGSRINDITATAEGRALLQMMLDNISLSIGNSIFDVVSYSNSDVITDSDANSWFAVTPDEWTDFKDQQTATAARGHITLMEDLKAAGNTNFNATLDSNDFNAAGAFIGGTTDADIVALFNRIKATGSNHLFASIKRANFGQQAIFLVSRSLYEAYEDYILTTYNQIPSVYQFFLNRGTSAEPTQGVLMFKGHPVVCMDEWAEFDRITGVTTHRIAITAPGNLGVGYDVQPLNQFGGAGLQVQVSPLLKDKGKAYMYTALELGATIVDPDLMAHASLIVTP